MDREERVAPPPRPPEDPRMAQLIVEAWLLVRDIRAEIDWIQRGADRHGATPQGAG